MRRYRFFHFNEDAKQHRAVHRAKFPAPLATSAEREVPRAGFMSVSYHTARRKRRAVCPHKELQSAFTPFITSERMRYKSLRTDKRKTAWPFFSSRLIRAIPSTGRSRYTSAGGSRNSSKRTAPLIEIPQDYFSQSLKLSRRILSLPAASLL